MSEVETDARPMIDFSKVEAKYHDQEIEPYDPEKDADPERVDRAFKQQQEILGIIREAGRQMCNLGKQLIPFRDERMYRFLGYTSFQEWYQDVGLSKTSVYRAINLYETFVLQFGLEEDEVYNHDIKKLDRLLPLKNKKNEEGDPILNDENADEWVSKCVLSEGDLIREINEAKDEEPSESDRMEEEENLWKGLYKLVKVEKSMDDVEQVSSGKIRVEIHKDEDDNKYARIL